MYVMIARFRIFFFSMLYASGNYIVKKKKRKDKKEKKDIDILRLTLYAL